MKARSPIRMEDDSQYNRACGDEKYKQIKLNDMRKELANYLNSVKGDTHLPLAQEAKFELLNYKSRKKEGLENHIEYLIKLVDADGVEIRYSITDYYNSKNEITDTRIWPITNNVELIKLIENDSRLGIKILGFITSKHFYRNDVLEAMYVKEMEDKIDSYYEK